MRDYTTLHSDTDWSKGTWETIQHYTQTQIEIKEQLVVRKNMDVTEHERLYNITLNTYWSRGTWETMQHYTQTQTKGKEHERLSNITRRH